MTTSGNGPRRLEVVKTNLCRYPPPWACALRTPAAPEIRYGDAPQVYREPMRPKEVLVLAEEYNFKEGTIYRASKELDGMLVNTAGKKAPGNRWEYVGQAAGQPTDRPHFNTSTLSHFMIPMVVGVA